MKNLLTLGSSITHRRTLKKSRESGIQHPYSVQAGSNDLLEQIITGDESWLHFYEPERKSATMVSGKRIKKH